MKRFWRLGLKGRLFVFILLTFSPAFMLSSFNSVRQLESQEVAAKLNIIRLARLMKMSEQQMLSDAKEFLAAVSNAPAVVGDDVEQCQFSMNRLVQNFHGYVTFGVANTNGDVYCRSMSTRFQSNIASLAFFKDAMLKRSIGIGPYEIDPFTGKQIVFLGMPVFNAANQVSKLVFTAVDLSQINRLAPAAQLEPDSVVKIFDQSGLILDRFPDMMAITGTHQPNMPLLKKIRNLGDEGIVDAGSTDGVVRLFGYTTLHKIPGQTVYLAVGLSTEAAYGAARMAFWTEISGLVVVSFVVLAFAWFGSDVLVLRKMQKVVDTTDRIRAGDLNARSGLEASPNSRDEIAHLGNAVDAMADVMQDRVVNLQRHDEEMHELMEMSEAMQACITQDEVLVVVRAYVAKLFPKHAVAIYLMHEGVVYLQELVTWNNPASKKEFAPDDCWAMRRGQPYMLNRRSGMPECTHLGENPPESYFCVPLLVHGQIIGLLHLQDARFPMSDSEPGPQQMARSVAEHITLVLANLKLREMLHNQATRDSLTGLFNRRFMEESLNRETLNAERLQSSISIIMLDLDHFKHFNDDFGHAAGDILLRETGRLLQTKMRGGDLACRYGGEEFVVILPGTLLKQAILIAETLRETIHGIRAQFQGRALGVITVSIGVACYPQHGKSWETVLHAADVALLKAKELRNTVVICDQCVNTSFLD
jgi:diguanylate cyclase (GGDEF)-like protein